MGATFLMCDLYRASVKGPSTEDGTVGVTEPDLMSPPRPLAPPLQLQGMSV